MKAEKIDRGPVALNSQGQSGVGSPLFHAAWLFAIGIGITHYIWLRPAWLLLSLIPVAILCGFAAIRAQRLIWVPVGVLWSILGVWCAEMQPQPSPEPALTALSDGLMRTVEGTVVDAAPVRNEPVSEPGEIPAEGPFQRVDVHLSSIEIVTDTEDVQKQAYGVVRT